MHTLLGKAGCSRAADGGADSCAVASRHPGNCQRLPRMCSVLVTLHSSGVLSCRPAISHVQNPAQTPLHQACAKACMWHAGTALDKVICLHQCCAPFPIALQPLFKTDVIASSSAAAGIPPSCGVSEVASGSVFSICRVWFRRENLMLPHLLQVGFGLCWMKKHSIKRHIQSKNSSRCIPATARAGPVWSWSQYLYEICPLSLAGH